MAATDSFFRRLILYRRLVDQRLDELSSTVSSRYLSDPLRHVFLGRGKRLRPSLVFLSARMFGVGEKQALPAAVSVEMLHSFSLVHDDIMDGDVLRHGRPTVHARWDTPRAILSGDLLFALAFEQLSLCGRALTPLARAFSEATVNLCEGQALDKEFEQRRAVTERDYLQMVALKTGALLSVAARMGGILGDATPRELRALTKFGVKIGQAFQIQDDLLEIFSSAAEMGKSLGSDVTGGKKTYLWCIASSRDPMGTRRAFAGVQGKNVEADVLPAMRQFYEKVGAVEGARSAVRKLAASAAETADSIGPKGHDLYQFIDMVLRRKR